MALPWKFEIFVFNYHEMLERQFGHLGKFIKRRYKLLIALWVIIVILLLPFAATSMTVTNYNVEISGNSKNSMSYNAQMLLDQQFNKTEGNSSGGTNVVLFVNSSLLSNESISLWNTVNQTYISGLHGTGIINVTSPFSISTELINSVSNGTYSLFNSIGKTASQINSSFEEVNSGFSGIVSFVTSLKEIDDSYLSTYMSLNGPISNVSLLLSSYKNEINNASGLVYGVPLQFLSIYEIYQEQFPDTSNVTLNLAAEITLLNETSYFHNSELASYYFNLFYSQWNGTTESCTQGPVISRLNASISVAESEFLNSLPSDQEKQFYVSVFEGFDVTSYQNVSERRQDLMAVLYNDTVFYSVNNTEMFDLAYQGFVENKSTQKIVEGATGYYLNETFNFTKEFFNETPTQFSSFFSNVSEVDVPLVERQLADSTLSSTISGLLNAISVSRSTFISYVLSNDSSFIKSHFTNATALNIQSLASVVGENATAMVNYFISKDSANSSYIFSYLFLKNHFEGDPYFYFTDAGKFVNFSSRSEGEISSITGNDYTLSGIALNSSVFYGLVPNDLSGFMLILNFENSSLNGGQLNTVNEYIYDIQSEFKSVTIYLTSADEIAHGLEVTSLNSLIYSIIIGIVISIVIVGIYFRSPFLAFLPLLFFAVSFAVTMGLIYLIYGIFFKTTLSFIVVTLSAILILGLSTDYSVYLINRYTREKGENRFENSMKWAGHAVFTSALTVIISYLVLSVFNIPLIGDGGVVNALGITISLAVALTLLPSLLYVFRKRFKERERRISFSKTAQVSRAHRNVLVVALVIIFIASLIVYEATPTSFDLFSLIPNNPGKMGYYEMVSSYGGDYLSPTYVLLTFSSPIFSEGHFNDTELNSLNGICNTLLSNGNVSALSTVTYPFGHKINLSDIQASNFSINLIMNQSLSFIGKDNSTVLVNIYLNHVSYSQDGINGLASVDSLLLSSTPANVHYLVGGTSQGLIDSSNSVTSSTYRLVEILAAIIFLVLAYQLSSFLTPIRLLFNVGTSALLAVTISYVLFYYILHLPIIVFGPLFVIVTLFGVGLDYDIFLVTRTREEVVNGKSDEEAISEAIKENAGVILVLGFILSGVFGSLIFSPIEIISEIGFSVTVGVLVDTTISWLFLIPALMLLLKRYNWWPSKIGKGRI